MAWRFYTSRFELNADEVFATFETRAEALKALKSLVKSLNSEGICRFRRAIDCPTEYRYFYFDAYKPMKVGIEEVR